MSYGSPPSISARTGPYAVSRSPCRAGREAESRRDYHVRPSRRSANAVGGLGADAPRFPQRPERLGSSQQIMVFQTPCRAAHQSHRTHAWGRQGAAGRLVSGCLLGWTLPVGIYGYSITQCGLRAGSAHQDISVRPVHIQDHPRRRPYLLPPSAILKRAMIRPSLNGRITDTYLDTGLHPERPVTAL